MRVAALDLGSNSFLCLIADVSPQGGVTVVSDLVDVVRLGEGVAESGYFSAEALSRAKQCLQSFSQEIHKYSPKKILAVATAATRMAKNRRELFAIGADLGIPIEVISGDDEADLTFLGTAAFESLKQLIIDIGGAQRS